MKHYTEEQLLDNLNKFYGLVDKYISDDRKQQLLDMYKDLEDNLVIAPASTKKTYHNAFLGGYIDHVMRVTEFALIFDKVWDRFGQKKDYSQEELVFSAINHDLGKLGYKDQPHYVVNDSEWHVKQGFYFKYNTQILHMRVADRSLYTLQKYGVRVSDIEFLAIKLHDGLYEESNKPYYVASADHQIKSNLPYILHQADLTATRIEQQNNKI
jgi:hypothetical protein